MKFTTEQRQESIFGAFDGAVSVAGVIFGLLVTSGSTSHLIAKAGAGGAIAAAVSMGAGEYEKGDSPWRARIGVVFAMGLASLLGGFAPLWPFFFFDKTVALIIAAAGCICVATWIGWEKRKGASGYIKAYLILLLAAGLTLGIISLIPASA